MVEGGEQSINGEFISFKDVGVDSLGRPFQAGSVLITTLSPNSWDRTRFKTGSEAYNTKQEFGVAFNGKVEEIPELLSVLTLRSATKRTALEQINKFKGMKPGESKLVKNIDWKSDLVLTLGEKDGRRVTLVSTVEVDKDKVVGPIKRHPERRMNSYEEVYLQLNKDFSWWRSREMPAEIEEGVDWADEMALDHSVDKARLSEINPTNSPYGANEYEDHYLKSRDYAVAVELAGEVFNVKVDELDIQERRILLMRLNHELFRGLNNLLQLRYREEERLFGGILRKDNFYLERLRFINRDTAEVNLLAKTNVIGKHFSKSQGIALVGLREYFSKRKEKGRNIKEMMVEIYSHELGHDRTEDNQRSEIWNEWLYVIYPRTLAGTEVASKGEIGYHYRGQRDTKEKKELGGAYTIQEMLGECLAASKLRKRLKISDDDVRRSILITAHLGDEYGDIGFMESSYFGFGDLYNQLFGKHAFETKLKGCENKYYDQYYDQNSGKDGEEKNLPRFGKLSGQIVNALGKKMLDE